MDVIHGGISITPRLDHQFPSSVMAHTFSIAISNNTTTRKTSYKEPDRIQITFLETFLSHIKPKCAPNIWEPALYAIIRSLLGGANAILILSGSHMVKTPPQPNLLPPGIVNQVFQTSTKCQWNSWHRQHVPTRHARVRTDEARRRIRRARYEKA
jgi:hypothetical protein